MDPVFTINPFREMVVKLHPHLERKDVIKMAYIMELPDSFEEEMGTLRDPFLFFMQEAERCGRVGIKDVDLLIDALVVLKKPGDVLQIVKEYKETHLQANAVWKKTTFQPNKEEKASEKDYMKYWLKFKDWCTRQNILDAKEASCNIVVDYLKSLTSSNKLSTIMHFYKGIIQHHQPFNINDKIKIEACLQELREQDKKSKS